MDLSRGRHESATAEEGEVEEKAPEAPSPKSIVPMRVSKACAGAALKARTRQEAQSSAGGQQSRRSPLFSWERGAAVPKFLSENFISHLVMRFMTQ